MIPDKFFRLRLFVDASSTKQQISSRAAGERKEGGGRGFLLCKREKEKRKNAFKGWGRRDIPRVGVARIHLTEET